MGIQFHPRKPGQRSEASLASRAGQPAWRSVDSECAGRVIEPRKLLSRGGRWRTNARRQHRRIVMARSVGSTGVKEQGAHALGSPRNLGESVVSTHSGEWYCHARANRAR